ncbi:hypothetical protein F5X71_13210 [Nocardia brasiliensis]|uniref:Uncharacterized protein n=1 Tax=Nocardia brasiliensis TaxID=37326 RepID=A0A6G9XQB2_NOCBR|nr:hypothetical protein [Nocardia brasiliensis]QIS03141.1 hypothetical protein F5X71_13210 [Nocardia brasiliensis]
MDISAASEGRAGPAAGAVATRPAQAEHAASDNSVAARAGGWGVLAGTAVTLVGLSWDIQWHNDVGPDTFFTLPHLFLYSGSAISGFVSLAMVFIATAAQRAGRPVPRLGGTPVRVFGSTLTAPLGYMIAGAGAALFLLYGLLDLEWHSIYGFDAVLNTPSHVALFLSITLTMIGSIIVFAAHRDHRWGRLGIVVAIPILITFAPILAQALDNLDLPMDSTILGVLFFGPLLLVFGAAVLARPGAALAIAVTLGVLQAILWWFSPWAAAAYADSIGLPLRDGLGSRPPSLPAIIPMFLLLAAVGIEALFWSARARGLAPAKAVVLAGGFTGVVVGVTFPLQLRLIHFFSGLEPADVVISAALGIALGLLAGFLAGRFARMLPTPGELR